MTTILKALRELEKRGGPVIRPAPPEMDWNRILRWASVTMVLIVLVGSAVGVVFLLAVRRAPDSISREIPTPVQQPQGVPESAGVRPQPISPAMHEQPWGRVAKVPPALAPAVAPPLPRAAAPPPKPRRQAAALETVTGARASVPGEPHVQVNAIAYASDPAARTVTLRIEGARAVTLREGESTGGLEVQLILPDAVYLRHGGSVFAVGATP